MPIVWEIGRKEKQKPEPKPKPKLKPKQKQKQKPQFILAQKPLRPLFPWKQ